MGLCLRLSLLLPMLLAALMSSGVYCPAGARRAQRQLVWYALFDEFAAEADSTVAPTLAGPVSVFKFVCKYIPPP